jgi:hypothetical protein
MVRPGDLKSFNLAAMRIQSLRMVEPHVHRPGLSGRFAEERSLISDAFPIGDVPGRQSQPGTDCLFVAWENVGDLSDIERHSHRCAAQRQRTALCIADNSQPSPSLKLEI